MSLRFLSVLSAAGLALAACMSPLASAPGPLSARDGAGRVVVAPLNLTVRVHEELRGAGGPVWDELLRQLQQRHAQVSVIDPAGAEALWLATSAGVDLTDRSAALQTAWSRFARELDRQRHYDLLILPSLVVRPAQVQGYQASWDGVRRPLEGSPFRSDASLGWVQNLHGEIAAASLHVCVLRPDGSLAFEGLAGLDLMQRLRPDPQGDGRWIFALREEPFRSLDHVRDGVGLAFERPAAEVAVRR